MERTLLCITLLTSFGIAEEANILASEFTQTIQQEAPKNLQNLGKGYTKDPATNQIYYKGQLIKSAHPESFKVYKDDSERPYQTLGEAIYDAEDYARYYIKGKYQYNEVANVIFHSYTRACPHLSFF